MQPDSIRKRFALSMAVVITFTMLIFSLLMIFYNSRSIEKDLQNQLAKLITFSQKSLGSALWQYNYDYIRDYIDSLFLYDDLVFVSIKNDEIELSKKKDTQELPFEKFIDSPKFIVGDTDVIYKNKKVGTVQLVLSRKRVTNLLMVSSSLAILILLIINVAIFGTNFLLSRKYLFKPLSKLEATVRVIAGGDLDASIDISSRDEIGQLARSFKQMMDNLRKITAFRDDLDHEVQERKKIELELKDSLKEKEVLLKEVHHRVKNNMQIIQSLLSLQNNKIENFEFKEAIQDSSNRIRSMALVHETLYRSEDFSNLNLYTYFESIIHGLFRIYNTPDKTIDWNVEVDSVDLDLDKSIACGLIINELVTNSLKYAFTNVTNGNVNIRLSMQDPGEVRLTVLDDGIGLPEGMDTQRINSIGLQIVRLLSEDQLDGRIDIFNDNGVTFDIRFPL